MAEVGLVDGDGWVSDESGFYGDEDTKDRLEAETRRELQLPYSPFAHIIGMRARSKLASRTKQNDDPEYGRKAKTGKLTDTKSPSEVQERGVTSAFSEEAGEYLQHNRFKDHPAARQPGETVEAFLERLPVAKSRSAQVGPWLWVSNFDLTDDIKAKMGSQDVNALVEQGKAILDAFANHESRVEGKRPVEETNRMPRSMLDRRDKLEEDLLAAAVRTGTTFGKWMLFPSSKDLSRVWATVARATVSGRLGPISKAGTYDASSGRDETLICVYTHDFTDLKDVRRVLDELLSSGLCKKTGKPIYYKCDAYTYLDITSNNSSKLRASLFSSKDMFGNDARVMENGPVARAQKGNSRRAP